jgi:hypothetical protein
MQPAASADRNALGTARLVVHLSALERMMRVPGIAGPTRLETALGRAMAAHALAVVARGGHGHP